MSRFRREMAVHGSEAAVASIVAATLGLLAFILAFTFSLAANRFEEKRKLVLEEANTIGTTYLRAGYLSDPYRGKIRILLKDYAAARLEAVHPEKFQEALEQSEQIQDSLWSLAQQVAEKTPNSIMAGLFIQSLNELIDVHAKRHMIAARTHIPDIIWIAIYFATFLGIGAMGYHTGLVGSRCIVVSVALILTYSAFMALIADLDRPQEGYLKVSQQSMEDLYHKLNSKSSLEE